MTMPNVKQVVNVPIDFAVYRHFLSYKMKGSCLSNTKIKSNKKQAL